MRFLSKTRRKFVYAIDDKSEFEIAGVKAVGGFVWFDRVHPDNRGETFKTPEECEAWYSKRGGIMKKQTKELFGGGLKALSITTKTWELMQTFMTNPQEFEIEDFRIYEDWLANNIEDRDDERFSLGILKAFKRTIVGKSRLIAHAQGPPGKGRYFRSRLVKMTYDEAIAMLGDDKKIRKRVEQAIEIDGYVYWVVPDFYIRAENVEMIKDMDAGIAPYSSIGFRASKLEPRKDDDGNILWWEYTDDGDSEALEGSSVFLGAQLGAGIRKDANDKEHLITYEEVTKSCEDRHVCQLSPFGGYEKFAYEDDAQKHDGKCIDVIYGIKDGKSEIQALRYKTDVWSAADAKAHCDSRGGTFEAAKVVLTTAAKTIKRGVKMKLKLESLGFEKEIELDEDSIKTTLTEVDEEILNTVAEARLPLDDEIKTLKADAEKSVEDNKELKIKADEGVVLKADLVKEAVKFGVFSGVVTDDKVEDKEKFLLGLSLEELKTQRDEYRKAFDEKFPNYGILPENKEDLNPNGDTKNEEVSMVPDSRYRLD